MLLENCYVSCSCNQTPTAVDWGENNLICYASCYSVRIYDPELGSGGKVISTLVGHKQRVNSVKWLAGPGINHEKEIVSGSSDGTAMVWTLSEGIYVPFILAGHSSSVNAVDGLCTNVEKKIAVVVTISLDSTLKVWRRNLGDFALAQNIDFGLSLCIAVKLSILPRTDKVVMACAQDTSLVQLYIEESDPHETSTDDDTYNMHTKFEERQRLEGHEDWVRGLDFVENDSGDLMLASSSQDLYIRIWKIAVEQKGGSEERLEKDKLKVTLDSVLTGHEGWIYSVNWGSQGLQLLSASLDKSMVIWELDKTNNLWLEKIRVGEVGGNTLGFYGGLFGPDGKSILGHSYQGAFHMWRINDTTDSWKPAASVGGHYDKVSDLAWDPKGGEFIMTVSADQTTRIHAPWSNFGSATIWHEIARPQVHGYDINSLAILSRYKFASAAEEKLIRTFTAPRSFVRNFRERICNAVDDEEGNLLMDDENVTPKGACVPSLGLSNKAVFVSEDDENDDVEKEKKSKLISVEHPEPPTEETLLQETLWPEIQKLYGHGYEVYALASSPDGRFLASACKSTNLEHSSILLWDQLTWKLVQKLTSHTLTVVQMAFSHDSQQLLSVSRDRRWSVFSKNADDKFELTSTTDKKTSVHTRIIWCCAWSHDSKHFATGSRDGKLVMWTRSKANIEKSILGEFEFASNLEFKNESITAVAFAPSLVLGSYLLAIGSESGTVKLYQGHPKQSWSQAFSLNNSMAHHLTVTRLAFRPVFGSAGCNVEKENVLQLASCSSDHSVRIYDVILE